MSSDLPSLPSDADLRRLVQFSSSDGRIWLAGQRMLLLHAAALGSLRRELMQSIGHEKTRRLLMRTGYSAGESDAALARKVRKDASLFDMFSVGPQLHMLEGAVKVTPLFLEHDKEKNHYHGIFRWDHSWEVETHVRDFGTQNQPVCWMLMGYASGYTSAFFGRRILYKEIQCVSCGSEHCLIEGRMRDAWEDGDEMEADYAPDSMLIELQNLQNQVEVMRDKQPPVDDMGPLLGRSHSFMAAVDLLRKAAGTHVTVLLTGETGVGKERFARSLHALSDRANKPFVAINCAALPPDLIESELFGAEKGAYTGSGVARPGRFERADGGTLMLDELGELPLPVQSKLLRVLQDGMVERLGSTVARRVDVRVVAATNVDLSTAVAQGKFRQDLLYRLNVYPIRVPPLRERVEDIELMAQHMLKRFSERHNKFLAGFSDRAIDALKHHDWPGNVRELENLIERGVILTGNAEKVDVDRLFPLLPETPSTSVNNSGRLSVADTGHGKQYLNELIDRKLSINAMEKMLIQEAVERSKGNISAAARLLGLTRPQLSYRLNKLQDDIE
jgi:DNA-binding NtrC family response regulator